ncbi:hypothetical protein [Methylophaga sp.]|uniref:hypothetical protein n=1 Tax=Methylophaga sp. TaxID=2024840 RepID=UPI003A92C0FE
MNKAAEVKAPELSAKTNAFELHENLTECALKLEKACHSKGFELRVLPIEDQQPEFGEDLYKALHSKAKDRIKSALNSARNLPVYSLFNDFKTRTHYVFFAARKEAEDTSLSGNSLEVLINALTAQERDKSALDWKMVNVVKSLITFLFKLNLTEKVSEEFELTRDFYLSDLYLGSKVTPYKKEDIEKYYISTLKFNCDLNLFGRLTFSLARKKFCATASPQTLQHSEIPTTFLANQKPHLSGFTTVDARSDLASHKYMLFGERYKQSINYVEQITYELIATVLSDAGIDFEPYVFKPSRTVESFVKLDDVDYTNNGKLRYVLTSKDIANANVQRIINHLRNDFSDIQEMSLDEFTELTQSGKLDKETPYLFFTPLNEDNKASISRLDTPEASQPVDTIDAYFLKKFWDGRFDPYTEIKLANLSEMPKICTQGVGAGSSDDADAYTKGESDDKFQKNLSTKLSKIKTEIFLKMMLHNQVSFKVGTSFEGAFAAIYLRSLSRKNPNTKKKLTMASAVSFNIVDGLCKIVSTKQYDDPYRLEIDFPQLKSRSQNVNDAFFLIDSEGCSLRAYSYPLTPQIIGRTDMNLASLYWEYENNGEPLKEMVSRKLDEDINVLPFYLVRTKAKQRYRVYASNVSRKDMAVFVSGGMSPEQTIENRNLMRTIDIVGADSGYEDVDGHPLTDLYLSSMTYNLIRLNESSRSSMFEKLARLAILN